MNLPATFHQRRRFPKNRDRAGLFLVSGPPPAARRADIVFLHGLGGNAWTSWSASNRYRTFWPGWLGPRIAHAAIWTVGYPASPTHWFGHATSLPERAHWLLNRFHTRRIGSRPLALIGHSMGGLVMKALLREAAGHSQSPWHSTASNLRAMIFIATPHKGSGWANFVQYGKHALRLRGNLSELMHGGEAVTDLHYWFIHQLLPGRDLLCHNFYETRPTAIAGWLPLIGDYFPKVMVVPKESGRLDEPPFIDDPLDEDHISISKPENRRSPLFRTAAALLERRFSDSETP